MAANRKRDGPAHQDLRRAHAESYDQLGVLRTAKRAEQGQDRYRKLQSRKPTVSG